MRGALLDALLELDTAVPYFDLSLQHADATLLRRMARWGSGAQFLALVDAIRARRPDAAFRSSFIVGFPGETEAAHDALLAVLAAAGLDWAGFFPYSAERGTPAATMDGAVPAAVRREWLAECEDVQAPITAARRDALVGTDLEVLVEGIDADSGDPWGRTHREAPEIDGRVHLRDGSAPPGRSVRATAVEALGVDLVAAPVAELG